MFKTNNKLRLNRKRLLSRNNINLLRVELSNYSIPSESFDFLGFLLSFSPLLRKNIHISYCFS